MSGKGFHNGAVASSHPLASQAGLNVLQSGGNVVDSAVATSAMLCVTQNNMCGLGGDFFALIKMGGKVFGLNGSGSASQNANIDLYSEKGLTAIPSRGPLSAITVPGIVASWKKLLDRFGTKGLSDLLYPAIQAAREGFPIGPKYSSSISGSLAFLERFDAWRRLFCVDGDPIRAGANFRQMDLANTLLDIAHKGCDSFYSGSLADKIIRGIKEEGGILTLEDFSRHTSFWNEPVKSDYRDLTIFETSPNSQGATVLLWLNMLEKFDIKGKYNPNSKEFLDLFTRTCLKAYAERAKSICDPTFQELPKEFLSKQFADRLLMSEDLTAPEYSFQKKDYGDTTYFCVTSSNGDCVSAIQSNYMGFGSGIVPRGTGFVLQNRGCYFTLDPRHHNCLKPGKKTFHTLCACLGERENRETAFCLGSMGGDVQPQIQIHLLTRIVDHRMDPQEAIDSPRFVIPFTIYEKPTEMVFEPGSDADQKTTSHLLSALKLERNSLPTRSSVTGHAQALMYSKEGGMVGGADPRGEGKVQGF